MEIEPVLGFVLGASGYHARTGPNLGGPNEGAGLDVPLTGVAGDARIKISGLEARALGALFTVGDTAQLRTDLVDDDGVPSPTDVGARLFGAYGELGYDLLHSTELDHQLVPFVRVEHYDTMAEVKGTRVEADVVDATGAVTQPGLGASAPAITDVVLGVSYRPIPQVALKSDVILRSPDSGAGESVFSLGVGWMF